MRATEALDLLKIIEVIGRNVDSPILLKGDMNGVQEVWCYDSAPVVTPFWPWIGKQEIKCFHRSSGQQITHCVEALYLQKPHIIQAGGFARSAADSTEQAFDPEKVFARHALRQRAKERTIAATKIHVQRCFAPEYLFQVEPIRQRLR